MNNSAGAHSEFSRGLFWLFVFWLVCVYAYLLYQTGWLSDDARITLEYVQNVVNANGAVFNSGERVQAYTHTLWFLLLSAATYCWYNPIQVVYLLSIGASLLSLVLLAKVARDRSHIALLAIAALLLSAGFIDYSTSGLENPLSYLLLALLVLVTSRVDDARKAFLWCGLLASCLFLNRPDYALIVFPLLLFLWFRLHTWRARFGLALVGALPVLIWTVFSLWYYGVPVPNTAYAKLGTAIPRPELLLQGAHYYLATARFDYFTLPVLLLLLGAALLRGDARIRLTAAGVVLYLLYVFWIGGDFMLSRHFATPLFLTVALFLAAPGAHRAGGGLQRWIVLSVALIVIPLFAVRFHDVDKLRMGASFYHGISDERVFWSQYTAFKSHIGKGLLQQPRPRAAGHSRRGVEKRATPVKIVCGWLGFTKAMERRSHIVDKCGLTDPLLARLPALETPQWRVGHFERAIPAGYISSLYAGGALFDDKLGRYAADIALIASGDLWSLDRARAIVRHNTSGVEYAQVLADYRIDVNHLERLRDKAGTEESSATSLGEGLTWNVQARQGKPPSRLTLQLSSPVPVRLILEYADPANYDAAAEKYWRQIDYVVAVSRTSKKREIEMSLPLRANHPQLVYVHVLPMGPVENGLTAQLQIL